MTAVFVINDKKSAIYDAIHISKTDTEYVAKYAYHVPQSSQSPTYTIMRTFLSIEGVLDYLETVAAYIDIDTNKPSTIDIQMDGFPCVVVYAKDFSAHMKNPSFQKGLVMGLGFRHVTN